MISSVRRDSNKPIAAAVNETGKIAANVSPFKGGINSLYSALNHTGTGKDPFTEAKSKTVFVEKPHHLTKVCSRIVVAIIAAKLAGILLVSFGKNAYVSSAAAIWNAIHPPSVAGIDNAEIKF